MDPEAKITEILKRGPKTSEFWLALLAQLLGTAMAVGLVPGGTPERVCGLVLSMLAAFGYQWSRNTLKRIGLELIVESLKSNKVSDESDKQQR